jgi:hypothetical protein
MACGAAAATGVCSVGSDGVAVIGAVGIAAGSGARVKGWAGITKGDELAFR